MNRSWPACRRARSKPPAKAKGAEGWRFTLQAPSYIAVMTYLDDRAIREEIWRAYISRAAAGERDNRPLILRILELRKEKSRLLGFADFADFILHDRMAHKGERAMAFVEDLREKTEKFFEIENAAL